MSISRLDVETFLFREARLADEHRYEEWLSLWTDDAIYWVPCDGDDTDPLHQVSLIYDDRARLGERIARLKSGTVLAQQPKPRMRRVISNIEIGPASEMEVKVESNFVLIEARGRGQNIWCGRSIHRLRQQDGILKMVEKKVLLVNTGQEMPVLQFLV
jgi:3-phenylpropionate/cinnamic acid dioxygenase small subunit